MLLAWVLATAIWIYTDTDAGVLVNANGADLALFTNSSLDAIASEDNFAFA